MKKHTFALGAIAGATSLAIAVPMIAQVAGAASTGSSSSGQAANRPAPSQECVLALAERDTNFLSTIDARVAAEKAATIAHRDALQTAASITDDTARMEALKKAQEDFHAAMEEAHEEDDAREARMEALKAACGDSFGPMHGMGDGPGMKGAMHGKLAEKLGMTQDELKAALDSGKTIEEIAEEKGVELPAKPEGGEGRGRGGMMRGMRGGPGR